MRTWVAEALLVAWVLMLVANATGGGLVQWVSALAVLLSFCHAQVAARMAEKQAASARPDVACWRWSQRYLVGKELSWCFVFAATGAWPALAGVALFLSYPAWRRYHRRRRERPTRDDDVARALVVMAHLREIAAAGGRPMDEDVLGGRRSIP